MIAAQLLRNRCAINVSNHHPFSGTVHGQAGFITVADFFFVREG